MAFLRYALPAVALGAQMAAAQCSVAATTTIQNAGDASALAACSTFSGSIAIATGTTDNIALNGIQAITGDLVASGVANMAQLSADSLVTIGQTFVLEGVITLTALTMPRLTMVDTVDWSALPNLQQVTFTSYLTKVSSLSIQNTGLTTLEGIDLQTADTVMITNNDYLEAINMQLGSVTNAMTISANGGQLVTTLPNLIWANNLTLWNQSSVSLPSLASVNGSLGFYSGSFENLTLANLTTVGSTMSVVSSDAVTNISMPALTTVGGGFQLANNSKLTDVDGFPKLQEVDGAVDFNGAFQNVSLPALKLVKGAFNLQSSNDITDDCNYFQGEVGQSKVIKGVYTCKGHTTPKGVGSVPAGTSDGGSGDGSNSTTKIGAASVVIPGAMGFMSFVAVAFGLL